MNAGVDEQLFKGATLSVNYQHIRGVHQFNSDAPNAYATVSSTILQPLQYQFQSEGLFNQNQLVTNINYRGKYGSLFGFYVAQLRQVGHHRRRCRLRLRSQQPQGGLRTRQL